jgi:hypothetical protein
VYVGGPNQERGKGFRNGIRVGRDQALAHTALTGSSQPQGWCRPVGTDRQTDRPWLRWVWASVDDEPRRKAVQWRKRRLVC